MGKGKLLLISAALLALLAVAVLAGSWGLLFQARARGIGQGFEAALVRTYQMGRPIPDGQFVVGDYRLEASHVVAQSREVLVKVRVMENRTGWKLTESTTSVVAY